MPSLYGEEYNILQHPTANALITKAVLPYEWMAGKFLKAVIMSAVLPNGVLAYNAFCEFDNQSIEMSLVSSNPIVCFIACAVMLKI